MKEKILTMLTLITASILLAGIANALIATVRPAKMYFDVYLNPSGPTYVEGDIYVKNKDTTPEHIELEKSMTFLNKMTLSQESFDLAPGEERAVHFIVKIYNLGTYSGHITVKFSTIGGYSLTTSVDADITIRANGYSTSTSTTRPTTSITTTIPTCKKLDYLCTQNSDCCSGSCELTTYCSIRSIHGICQAYRTGYACVPGGSTTTTTPTTTPTTVLTSTTIVTTTTPICILSKDKPCTQNSDCCSGICQESKICTSMTIHGICLSYRICKVCADGSTTTTPTTTPTTTTSVITTVQSTTTTISGCFTTGQTCSSNGNCCSQNCQYSRFCVQYDVHNICQRYSNKYVCA